MYQSIALAMLIAGVSLFTLGLVLSITWNLPALWSDVSGRSAERAITSLKHANQGKRDNDLSTADLYFSMSSGSLKGYEATKTGIVEGEEQTAPVVVKQRSVAKRVEVPQQEEEIATGLVTDGEAKTGLMDSEDISTGLMNVGNNRYCGSHGIRREFTHEVSSLEELVNG